MEKNMKHAGVSGTLCLAVLAAFASPGAQADEAGWYLGGNIGQSRATIDNERIIGGLLAAGFATTAIDDNDRELGYKVFGGYQFSRHFALEGGYFDLGEFGFEATTLPPGSLRGDMRVRGVNLDALGILPFTDRFSAFARVGVNYAQTRDHFSGTGAVNVPDPDRDERAANYKFGAGLQYDITEALGLRAEAERYRIDDAVGNKGDIDLFSIGLVYRFFGKTPPPAPVVAAAEPVVAPAPAPPPPQPPPPPPPAPRTVTFSADSLFDFDETTVKPAGKQALDALVVQLRQTRYDLITVTGHSDRIGSHDYNMALSTRRAEAVKAYLVESAGIQGSTIEVRGVDGANPVTRPGECVGPETPRASAQLIACLQPDRRVEVEVTATK